MVQRNYSRSGQTEPGTGGDVYDLSTTVGSSTQASASTSSTSYVEVLRWQRTVGAGVFADGSQTWAGQVDISAIDSNAFLRFRFQRINSSGVVQSSSAYSAVVEGATGVESLSTTWDSGTWASGDRLALSVEMLRATGHGNVSSTHTRATTYIDAPESGASYSETLTTSIAATTTVDDQAAFAETISATPTATTTRVDTQLKPVELQLATQADPGVDTDHTIYIVMRETTSDTGTVTVQLRQGSTVIQQWTGQTLTDSFAEYTFDVTSASSITNYGDLRIRVFGSDAATIAPKISQVYLELPAAAGFSESLSTSITATTTVDDQLNAADSLSTSVAATTTEDDNANWADTLTTSVVATTTSQDSQAKSYQESLSTSIVATTTVDENHAIAETLTSSVTATTTSDDNAAHSETLTTAVTATTTATGILHMVETAGARFDDASYGIATDDTTLRLETNNAFTFAVRFMLQQYDQNVLPRLFEKAPHYLTVMGDPGNGRFRNIGLEVVDTTDNASEFWGDTELELRTWYDLVVTFDGDTSTCTMTLNGVAETITPIFAWGNDTMKDTIGDDFYVGRRSTDLNRNTYGWIDHLIFWDRALGSSEVTDYFNGDIASDFNAFWPLDADGNDLSANGNDLTLTSVEFGPMQSAVAATTTVGDTKAQFETLATSVVSTVVGDDDAAYAETLTTSITSSVTMNDTYTGSGGTAYSESLSTSITATTTVDDVLGANDALTTSISATTATGDALSAADSLSTAIAATTTATETYGSSESLSTSIVSTVTGDDIHGMADTLAVSVTATTTAGDTLAGAETLTTPITATTTAGDTIGTSGTAYIEQLFELVFANVVVDDTINLSESYTESIVSTVTVTSMRNRHYRRTSVGGRPSTVTDTRSIPDPTTPTEVTGGGVATQTLDDVTGRTSTER